MPGVLGMRIHLGSLWLQEECQNSSGESDSQLLGCCWGDLTHVPPERAVSAHCGTHAVSLSTIVVKGVQIFWQFLAGVLGSFLQLGVGEKKIYISGTMAHSMKRV